MKLQSGLPISVTKHEESECMKGGLKVAFSSVTFGEVTTQARVKEVKTSSKQ